MKKEPAGRKPPVARNDDVTLTITALGAEGQGVGRVEGYAVFVPGALPGERIAARIIKAGSGYGVGKLLRIEEESPSRVLPECSIHGRCGGCTLQHLSYESQLTAKHRQVVDALTRIGGFSDIEVAPVLGMEHPWRYRNKGSFPLATVNGRVEAGFFAPRSHRLIPAADCPIQREPIVRAARTVADWANEFGVSAYDEESRKGLLRHVMARSARNGDVMAVVVATGPLPHQKALIDALRENVEGLKSIYLNINPKNTNVILGREYRLLWGEGRLREEILGLRFSISPASFLQVNPIQTERLYQTALDFLALNGTERVLDAYCGIGTISLLLARRAKSVIGVEDVQEAVRDAAANARENDIGNARFIAAPAEKALPNLLREVQSFDAIVADPPRKGCEENFLRAVLESGAPRMVYVSCNPATLARDCRILRDGGFRIERVQPVDMFPHTAHVETVVLLKREDA